MKEIIKNSYSRVQISEQTKKRIYGKIVAERESRQRMKRRIYRLYKYPVFAAFAFVLVIYGSSQVRSKNTFMPPELLEELLSVRGGFLKSENPLIDYGNTNVADAISKNVFSFEDEHVRFEVVEKLTDSVLNYMTIRYKALDGWGREWLNKCTENGKIEKKLYAQIVFPDNNTSRYGVNYANYVQEIPRYHKEDEKYFVLLLAAISGDYMSNKITIQYQMPDGLKNAELDVGEELEFVKYRLSGDDHEHYSAEYLYVSGLSYVIYGTRGDVSFSEVENIMDGQVVSLYYRENGEEKKIESTGHTVYYKSVRKSAYNQYSNLMVAGGSIPQEEVEFVLPEDEFLTFEKVTAFDADSLTKISIRDEEGEHVYRLEKL